VQKELTTVENSNQFLGDKTIPKDVLSHAKMLLEDHAYKALQGYLVPIDKEEQTTLQNWSSKELFELKWLLAEAFFSTQKNTTSFQYAEEGLELASELSKEEQSKAHYQIARNYGELGSLQSALEHILLAYELGDKENPIILNAIGVIHYRRKNYDEAYLWYKRGLDTNQTMSTEDQSRVKAILLQNISFLYFDQQDYKKSLSYSLKSLAAIPASHSSTKLKLHYELVKGYLKLDDIENAEIHFMEASAIEEQLASPKKSEYYLNYATLLEAKEEFTQAESVLLEGIAYIQENHTAWLSTAYERLKDLYKKQGIFEKALEISENRYDPIVKQLNHDFDKQTSFLLSKVQHDRVKQEREFYRKQSQILSENLTEAQFQAHTDALTGIHNRTYFDYISKVMFSSAVNLQQPLSILMIDIDYFKKVNDDFGHLVGDTVLKIVATLMKDNLRKEDILARYGGEEFTVLLPNTVEAMALVVAEKMRCEIESYNWGEVVTGLAVTISIGVCQDDESLNTSINIADKRLYEAKELGRNRSVGS